METIIMRINHTKHKLLGSTFGLIRN